MIYFWAIVIYLAILIGISVYRSLRVKTQDDFMVAGRRVTAIFLVGTLVCTWIGSGSLFGGAGRAFRNGFSALWMSAGAWAGIAIVYFLAHRVRRIAQYTVPDLLETRYNPSARVLGTVAIIIAYLTIASYQFIGGGRLLNILLGWDPAVGAAVFIAEKLVGDEFNRISRVQYQVSGSWDAPVYRKLRKPRRGDDTDTEDDS